MVYIETAKKFKTIKKLGQNFLIDPEIVNFIINNIDLQPDETVIEIGAGLGFLTELLAQKVKKVIAVEIDADFIAYLSSLSLNNVDLIQKDILKVSFSDYVNEPVKVIANIPYYITTPILLHLLGEIGDIDHSNRQLTSEIIIMVQKEVGKRIAATNNSKNKEWGALSVLINYWAIPTVLREVPAKSFWPKPKVDSAILKLQVHKQPLIEAIDPKHLRTIVKASFNFRRKTLKNALKFTGISSNIIMQTLNELGWEENIRGEILSVKQFAELSDKLLLVGTKP